MAEARTYLRFLSARAAGSVPTGATMIRDFVSSHPAYNKDSKLNQQINYDLLEMMSGLNNPDSEARHNLLGEFA